MASTYQNQRVGASHLITGLIVILADFAMFRAATWALGIGGLP